MKIFRFISRAYMKLAQHINESLDDPFSSHERRRLVIRGKKLCRQFKTLGEPYVSAAVHLQQAINAIKVKDYPLARINARLAEDALFDEKSTVEKLMLLGWICHLIAPMTVPRHVNRSSW